MPTAAKILVFADRGMAVGRVTAPLLDACDRLVALTAMTPLQFQKWMRQNEARQLMLPRNCDAATASYQVGYGSPSQFSREYRRLFGAPPLRDIRSLQQVAEDGRA